MQLCIDPNSNPRKYSVKSGNGSEVGWFQVLINENCLCILDYQFLSFQIEVEAFSKLSSDMTVPIYLNSSSIPSWTSAKLMSLGWRRKIDTDSTSIWRNEEVLVKEP